MSSFSLPGKRVALPLLFAAAAVLLSPHVQAATPVNAIRAEVSRIEPAQSSESDLARFYASRNYRPAWSLMNAALALRALEHAEDEGLRASDYDVTLQTPEVGKAPWDVKLSADFLRYMHDVRTGRVAPSAVSEDFGLTPEPFDAVAELNGALASGRLAALIAALPPQRPEYISLRAALTGYRALAADGWMPIQVHAVKSLTALTPDAREALRARLAAEDANVPGAQDLSPSGLKDALGRFQARMGLAANGALDAKTIAALNVTPAERMLQIETNMERWRWLPRLADRRYVEVNTPDASLKIVQDGRTILTSKVVLGRRDWDTPIIATRIEGVVVNPPWHVPPDMAGEEILPKLLKDPSYLAANNMVLVDGPPSDPHGVRVNWHNVRADAFPYRIQQLPGPGNGLGTLLLDMPNDFDIYLHDTPAKQLFAENERFLSHGCVRVEQIKALASYALFGDLDDAAKIPQPAKVETVRVPLPEPLPVYVMYWTAFADADGAVAFRPDIYGFDMKLLAAFGDKGPAGARTGLVAANPTPTQLRALAP